LVKIKAQKTSSILIQQVFWALIFPQKYFVTAINRFLVWYSCRESFMTLVTESLSLRILALLEGAALSSLNSFVITLISIGSASGLSNAVSCTTATACSASGSASI
jgi:hypothetical protein